MMLQVGPIFNGTLPGTTLVFGISPMLLGPNTQGKWVFLGHESLTTIYFIPASTVISSMTVAGVTQSAMSCGSGAVSYMTAMEEDMYAINIDAVDLRDIGVNGAEVLQWQQ